MARGISGIEIEQYFDSVYDAKVWGRDNFKSKHDYTFVDVRGKTYLLCATGMCDDYMLRGKLEDAVIAFFNDMGLKLTDDSIYIDLGADMNEVAWKYLTKYCEFDVIYAVDSY